MMNESFCEDFIITYVHKVSDATYVGTHGSHNTVMNLLELKLHVTEPPHVYARKHTWVFCKSSRCP